MYMDAAVNRTDWAKGYRYFVLGTYHTSTCSETCGASWVIGGRVATDGPTVPYLSV